MLCRDARLHKGFSFPVGQVFFSLTSLSIVCTTRSVPVEIPTTSAGAFAGFPASPPSLPPARPPLRPLLLPMARLSASASQSVRPRPPPGRAAPAEDAAAAAAAVEVAAAAGAAAAAAAEAAAAVTLTTPCGGTRRKHMVCGGATPSRRWPSFTVAQRCSRSAVTEPWRGGRFARHLFWWVLDGRTVLVCSCTCVRALRVPRRCRRVDVAASAAGRRGGGGPRRGVHGAGAERRRQRRLGAAADDCFARRSRGRGGPLAGQTGPPVLPHGAGDRRRCRPATHWTRASPVWEAGGQRCRAARGTSVAGTADCASDSMADRVKQRGQGPCPAGTGVWSTGSRLAKDHLPEERIVNPAFMITAM